MTGSLIPQPVSATWVPEGLGVRSSADTALIDWVNRALASSIPLTRVAEGMARQLMADPQTVHGWLDRTPTRRLARLVRDTMRTADTGDLGGSPAGNQAVANARMSAAYLANSARRVVESVRSGVSPEEAMAKEDRYLKSHMTAAKQRIQAAKKSERLAKTHGMVLGWYAVLDSQTSPECRAANGHNFHALLPPSIGYPGTVHPNCRCGPGLKHPRGRMLSAMGLSNPSASVKEMAVSDIIVGRCRPIELAYGDHKPPYDWKHGWIPITSEAQKVATKKLGKERLKDLNVSVTLSTEPSRAQSDRLSLSLEGRYLPEKEDQDLHDKLGEEYRTAIVGPDINSWHYRELMAVAGYTFKGDVDINMLLRGKKVDPHKKVRNSGGSDLTVQESVDVLNSLSGKHKTSRPMVVYRGSGADHLKNIELGDEISDPAFLSTSYDPNVSYQFMKTRARGSRKIFMKISVPAGMNVVPIGDEIDERELLFPPGTKLRVTQVSGDVIDLEMIP